MCCGNDLFGGKNKFIKTDKGNLVAVDGSNIAETLILSDMKIPYKQILKASISLKPGQVNYLLNYIGLGDNATFVAIRAIYDSKLLEVDKYLEWSYYDDLTKINNMGDIMILTGNSEHRIPQIYLTNPNTEKSVRVDVMIGIVDEEYSVFTDVVNQSGTSFVNLEYTDIHSHNVGTSIFITDKSNPVRPLIYLPIGDILSIDRVNKVLVLDDSNRGTIFLAFRTIYDTNQAYSLLNYVVDNPSIDIDSIVPLNDDEEPIIYFNSTAGTGGDYIALNGATFGVPYNTSIGLTFSTNISISAYGDSNGFIDKANLLSLIIDDVIDDRDGNIYITPNNLILSGTYGNIDTITTIGTYSLNFDIEDRAKNNTSNVNMLLNIIL